MDITLLDITLIGYVAGVCTTFAFAPQLARAWRTRSTGDISLGMYAMAMVGTALWLTYGALLRDPPIMLANGVSLCFQLCIVTLKLRHG